MKRSFPKYYTPNVEIKVLSLLIDGKIIEELYEKIIEMTKNNDYTTGNLLDY